MPAVGFGQRRTVSATATHRPDDGRPPARSAGSRARAAVGTAQQLPTVDLTAPAVATTASAVSTQAAAPAAQSTATLVPTGNGATVRHLFQLQASGTQAGARLPILGDQATASYARYLKSFEHEIPEFFETDVTPASGASGSGR